MCLDQLPELRDTELAHKEAMLELERMTETMDKMELERAEMVAEVEAQIERALASMAVGMDDSDYGSSRPHSRLSNISNSSSLSRRASDSPHKSRLRSFATESTLAESCEEVINEIPEAEAEAEAEADHTVTNVARPISRETGTILEDEEPETTGPKKKRFSASDMEVAQDGMTAVDEGISQKSDKIAQKVLEIQQKVGIFVLCCFLHLNHHLA